MSLLPLPSHVATSLPEGASETLRADNLRIVELKKRYSILENASAHHSGWTDEHVSSQIEWPYFRGDNAYIWQLRDENQHENYQVTADYIESRDRLGLLEKLTEDGAFGVYQYHTDEQKAVSRDLLDSIMEIYFLEDQLGLSKLPNINILDIGAGYGRLAYRMATAMPNIGQYFCVDAVAESTFLSEYYLKYRQVTDKAAVVALDQVEDFLQQNQIDLAINIHSFSECAIDSIEWWIKQVRKNQVKYFMIVPNCGQNGGKELTSIESDRTERLYDHLLAENNYELVCRQPKFLDPKVQACGVSPTYYYLYKLAI
jgi:putative sugar O-methyltransferase